MGSLPTNSINEEAANPPPLPLYKGAWQPTPSSLALISHSPLLSTPLHSSPLLTPLPHTLLLPLPTKLLLLLAPWPAMAMESHQDEAPLLPQASPHHESIPLTLFSPNLWWIQLSFSFLLSLDWILMQVHVGPSMEKVELSSDLKFLTKVRPKTCCNFCYLAVSDSGTNL